MTNLGYANGWIKEPELYREAKSKGYKFVEKRIDDNIYEYVCKELDFKFCVDSSD